MEWQAGYASGSLLMPVGALQRVVEAARRSAGLIVSPTESSTSAAALIKTVAAAFEVSADAARVRLTQLRLSSASKCTDIRPSVLRRGYPKTYPECGLTGMASIGPI